MVTGFAQAAYSGTGSTFSVGRVAEWQPHCP